MKPASQPLPRATDWFVPAILHEGSVEASLGEVIRSEELRLAFLQRLRTNLCAYRGQSSDSVSELRRRVREFENTLQFRLGMLSAEREGAWFRSSMTAGHGPFGASVLSEPVFAPFRVDDLSRLKTGLQRSWAERRLVELPFEPSGPCLWLRLLELNQAYGEVVRLGRPFGELSLDQAQLALPAVLESPALSAFLGKVQEALSAAREDLERCYRKLWEASEGFWLFLETKAGRERARAQEARREETRQNREAWREAWRAEAQRGPRASAGARGEQEPLKRSGAFSANDWEALKFMKFDDLPTRDELRRRYLELARQFHPDTTGGDDEAFKSLSRAYTHLSRRLDLRPRSR